MISLKCRNCGSDLVFRSEKGSYFCEYCNSEFFVGSDVSSDYQYTVVAGILKEYKGSAIYIVIPNTVKKIEDSCFLGMDTIESVYIPESVTKIGNSAFKNCKGLKEIIFSDNLYEIGDAAFKNTGLQRVVLPRKLKNIGRDAFMQCEELESVVLPDLKSIKYERTFKLCQKLKEVDCDLDCFCKSVKSSKDAMKNGDTRSTFFDAFQATPFYNEIYDKIKTKTCLKCGGTIGKKGICQKCGETYVDYGGRCYIATAVYGSYDCPQVWTLRRYRDFTLSRSIFGKMIIRIYYKISPTFVLWFGKTKWFKNLGKYLLDKKVEKLQARGVESSPYDDIYTNQ